MSRAAHGSPADRPQLTTYAIATSANEVYLVRASGTPEAKWLVRQEADLDPKSTLVHGTLADLEELIERNGFAILNA